MTRAQAISNWPKLSRTYFKGVQDRLKAFVNTGQLGLFANGYWGHSAYKTKLRGTEPRELVVWGMQPAALELGWELSEPVAAHLNTLVDAAALELQCWGLDVKRRNTPYEEGDR
jgi:Ni,Fe-hydrogenase I large subunit